MYGTKTSIIILTADLRAAAEHDVSRHEENNQRMAPPHTTDCT